MRIPIYEHKSVNLSTKTDNGDVPNGHCVIEPADFDALKKVVVREVNKDSLSFNLKFMQQDNVYSLCANYYVGLDWLLVGRKYVHIEPKVNLKLVDLFENQLNDISEGEDTASLQSEEDQRKVIEEEPEKELRRVNYLKMLLEVYSSDIPLNEIGNLVQIYWNDPPISIPQQDDMLTPVLIAQFLTFLKAIVRKGLKKNYYKVEKNLVNRVRGKILIGKQMKLNTFKNQHSKVYCEYQEYGIDSAENRYLKKVLQYCINYIQNFESFFEGTKSEVNSLITYCRPAFDLVGECEDLRGVKVERNPFYKEYEKALRIGGLIMKQFGYNISCVTDSMVDSPPFWIDMPRLFELYVYQMLLKSNPSETKRIMYQFSTYGNSLDFLIKNGSDSLVVDTKYKLHYKSKNVHEDIRQVSGYARLKKVLKELSSKNGDFDESAVLPCLIIYPDVEEGVTSLSLDSIKECISEAEDPNGLNNNKYKIAPYLKMYKIGVKLPLIKS